MNSRKSIAAGSLVLALLGAAAPLPRPDPNAAADNKVVAESLAAMLQAARSVISSKQALIDDPSGADKNLTGQSVLDAAGPVFQQKTGRNPASFPPNSRGGRLLAAEMAAIAEVVDANQQTFSEPGVGFKGFIPAVFARLVSEEFSRRVKGAASMRVTAPEPLVRNRKSRPDRWERNAIEDSFLRPGWAGSATVSETVTTATGPMFRLAVPEYYDTSCLSCHGGPKGSLDRTGYPREGASAGDLGGVISITLRP